MISQVLEIANKFIPDKTNQGQLELELRKLEIEELKVKTTYIEKLHNLIPFVLPAFLLSLLVMFGLNYLSDFINGQIPREAPIIHIDDRMVEICKTFIMFLFGKKTIEKFSPYNKIKE